MNNLLVELRKIAQKILSLPSWDDKCWGKVWHRFNDNIINESLLIVNSKWQCSVHYHKYRFNAFISSSATIGIEVWDRKYNDRLNQLKSSKHDISSYFLPNINHILRPGSCYVVPPNTFHRFYVIEPGEIIEVYWVNDGNDCSMDDIVRINQGGPRAY